MKKNQRIIIAIIPVLITLSIYLVFYSRITCKPVHAGFWMILALGMAIGVALTGIFSSGKTK
jgi:hypothetical protein